ncbi:MAG: hypothetical protein RL701_1481 [Pseudomonadota bacterium]
MDGNDVAGEVTHEVIRGLRNEVARLKPFEPKPPGPVPWGLITTIACIAFVLGCVFAAAGSDTRPYSDHYRYAR